MIVYGSSLSPFVRKVLVFAAEKGIAVDSKVVVPGADDPDFLAASPFRKIPALQDGDFRVCDSSAIIAYLDALKPAPELIPADPKDRARTIWYDEFMDTILFECGRKLFFNRIVAPMLTGKPGDLAAADRAEREELPPLLDYLEGVIPESGFLVADRLTLADIAVAAPFVNFRHLGIAPDPATQPKLAAWVDAMLARESFAPLVARETAFLTRMAA
ncbi:MAG: glutathione S-transferase family protein [Sphingomonas sp.]|nr:glutathione S-transferase family protein [Sphingomonas sp.]